MSKGAPVQTILVVEDDAAVRSLITTALRMNDYRLEVAATGEAAIAAATRGPDLVMLDLGLPDMDGVTVIEKIRSWSTVPIIVISARTEDADKIAALDAGADDYLTKPFSVDELLARVRAWARRARGERVRERAAAHRLCRRLRLHRRRGAPPHAHRVQAPGPAVAQCRQGPHAHVHHP